MGGIGKNLQLQSDGSEIVCAIRAPHKTYAYKILWQNMSYFASYGEKWVCQTLQIWVFLYAHVCSATFEDLSMRFIILITKFWNTLIVQMK